MLASGEVRCWGANSNQQLGDSTTINRSLPTPVLDVDGIRNLTGVRAVDAGVHHGCALLISGEVRCWGARTFGRLGDGLTTTPTTAVAVRNEANTANLSGVRSISVGYTHTCASMTSGAARCWGSNGNSKLGDGTATTRSLPTPVRNETDTADLTDVVGVALGGYSSCFLLGDGGVRCAGRTTTSRSVMGLRSSERCRRQCATRPTPRA